MEATATPLIDTLSHDELRSLIAQPAGSYVSLFLPIQRIEPARRQNPIRLENLLRQAETRLLTCGMSLAAAQALLAPAWQLIKDRSFWVHQSDGLAIFVGPDLFRSYRLPLAFEELVVVDERPHIAPLLSLLQDDGPFYLLALSLDGVQMLHATHYSSSPVAVHDVPTSLQDSLKYDEFAKQPQFHPGVPGRGGERGAIFHGQGALDDQLAKEEILRYFQQVNRGVCAALRDEHAPLLLAGVAYLLPIYRAANSYPHLLEEGILHNPDDLHSEELHARAWALTAPHFAQARGVATERYRLLADTQPTQASSYLRAIVPAAYEGRIATLFVATGAQQWGRFDPGTGELSLHEAAEPRDSELLDAVAIQTILHGGTIYAVTPEQMPEAAPVAAIFRY